MLFVQNETSVVWVQYHSNRQITNTNQINKYTSKQASDIVMTHMGKVGCDAKHASNILLTVFVS